MDILVALKQEESKLHQQLRAVQGAIQAFNGVSAHVSSSVSTGRKRTMSAAARAAISRATKARWAKFRADKAKKARAA